MEMADQRLHLAQQNLRPVVANAEPRLAEVKSRFFSAAAHELRTPLTTIVGYLEMLLDEEFGPLSKSQREPLEMVSESVCHLRAVTNNLLTAARLEAGQVELNMQPTDLASLVRGIVADLEPHLKAKARCLELRVSPHLPPALCDEGKATQITCNLLSKACERTLEREGIGISIALAEEEGFLQVMVAYGGAGVGAEGDIEGLSRSSPRGDNGPSEIAADGLGLYVTRALVELQGGRLWCRSGSGESGMVCVTFPAVDKAGAA
jgi:two-component system phosphate regulon sensor histidine kinase PhoR